MKNAPIALFVYNRPDHTRRTLEALRRNRLSDTSTLYIFADGPRTTCTPAQVENIKAVRRLIRLEQWCQKVEILESETNKGLAASIVSGVTTIASEYGRVIVLEDDLVTSMGFLSYMNDALRLYENDDRIMHVNGFNFKTSWFSRSTGLLRASHPWGWGTWHRAWQHYRPDAHQSLSAIQEKDPRGFDLEGTAHHLQELEQNVTGELKTWAVRWYASIFLQEGLCLYPRTSLVRNIGFDGTGENCHADRKFYESIPVTSSIKVQRLPLQESPDYLLAHQAHYHRQLKRWTQNTLKDRIVRKITRFLRRSK